MSINLTADNNNDLLQTPTWITYLALYDHSGNQRDWKETRHIYISWLDSLKNGKYDSEEECREYRDFIDRKKEEVMSEGKINFSCG